MEEMKSTSKPLKTVKPSMWKRVYTFYKDSDPGKKIAELVILSTLTEDEGNIRVYEKDLAPIEVLLAEQHQNNIDGVKVILESRTVQPTRMFFQKYCEERKLNPFDIDDRLSLSEGRTMTDDYFIVKEQSIVD